VPSHHRNPERVHKRKHTPPRPPNYKNTRPSRRDELDLRRCQMLTCTQGPNHVSVSVRSPLGKVVSRSTTQNPSPLVKLPPCE
jgi:hypothetical protein